jgi:hypothetical protein
MTAFSRIHVGKCLKRDEQLESQSLLSTKMNILSNLRNAILSRTM